MKLINNSLDTDLQASVANGDLEKEMASIVSMSGQQSEENGLPKKTNLKQESKPSALSNGVHKVHSNGAVEKMPNGYYDDISDDDDYELKLESSSDDGRSPLKKIDEDTISAPQIVQEIEDLLGIDAGSVGIDDELVNLDSAESIDLNEKEEENLVNPSDKVEETLDSSEAVNNTLQEVKVVFAECSATEEKVKHPVEENKEKDEPSKSELNECDSSSNMNVVFDEVEIGTDADNLNTKSTVVSDLLRNIESSDASDSKNSSHENSQIQDEDCRVESTTENIAKSDTSKSKIVTDIGEIREDKNSEKIVETVKDVELAKPSEEVEGSDILLSQSSGFSSSSAEWTVVDSVAASDIEEHQNTETTQSEDNILEVVGESTQLKRNVKEEETGVDSKSPGVTQALTSITGGEETQKRLVSDDVEMIEPKKPKLYQVEDNGLRTSLQSLKRPHSDTTEVESKRRKAQSFESNSTEDVSEKCTVYKEMDKEECEKMIDNTSGLEGLSCTEEDEKKKLDEGLLLNNDDDNNATNNENDGKSFIIREEEIVSTQIKHTSENNISEKSTPQVLFKTNLSSDSKDSTKSADFEVMEVDVPHSNCFQSNNVDSASVEKNSEPDAKQCLPNKVLSTDRSLDEICEGNNLESSCDKSVRTVELAATETIVELENESCKLSKENSEVSSSSSDGLKDDVELICETGEKEDKTPSDEENTNKSRAESIHSIEDSDKTVEKTEADKVIDLDSHMDEDKEAKPDKHLSSSTSNERKIPKSRSIDKLKNEESTRPKSPFEMLTKNMQQQKTETAKMTNLDKSIESVVKKARTDTLTLPLLKKFHKEQLEKLTRSDLEEMVVLKICEAITDRSDIGQMRLRCQTLEQNNELWRKKVLQFEKQNRELEMVLKRFLSETAHMKRENGNKITLPIRVTRSVGLQVVLASSMHGTLVASRNRANAESAQSEAGRSTHQQTTQKPKPVERDPVRGCVKTTTLTPPTQTPGVRGRGRPPKHQHTTPSASTNYSPRPSTSKTTPPSTPIKPIAPKPPPPSKDLEVIDLTDKEEKTKASPSPSAPVVSSIRVNPSTQVCFVQNTGSNSAQQMAYIVQKPGERKQYLVPTTTTAIASSSKSVVTVSQRPTSSLALPVFRAGGQIIPVQATTPQVAIRSKAPSTTPALRQVPQNMRPQTQLMHPAPLPTAQTTVPSKAGFKAPPTKPQLKIAKTVNGIMLSWSMSLTTDMAEMSGYQLFAYQEGAQAPSTSLWKKVGDVKALPLPMACTLTQFIEGHKYHFAVRAVDIHGRIGPFSQPSTILLTK